MLRREILHRLVDLLDHREQRFLQLLLIHRLALVEPGSIVVSFQPPQKTESRLREVRAHPLMVIRWSGASVSDPAARHRCCILKASVIRSPGMELSSAFIGLLVVLAFVFLITILKTLYTVRTATAGVVERFGKFDRITRPGLHLLVPFAERVYFVDLQVRQASFSVETKTRDNVFVQIPVSVQYQVLEEKIYDAFYRLSSPQKQIESFVFNSILGHVPKLTLDETFEQQSGISVAVKVELDTIMSGFGFNIMTALVTDIIPDIKVKNAMNDINAAQRAQVAAQARGEAEKILKVKQAEAEAESKALQGKGIAAERQAIIDGLRASIEHFRETVPGSTADDVMALVLLTQYFDTLRDIGTRGGTNTIFLPNNPGAANDFQTQILAGLRGGSYTSQEPPAPRVIPSS